MKTFLICFLTFIFFYSLSHFIKGFDFYFGWFAGIIYSLIMVAWKYGKEILNQHRSETKTVIGKEKYAVGKETATTPIKRAFI